MFAYIKGALAHATPGYAVVEAGGIGYKIYIPANVFSALPQQGQIVTLYTSFVVREDAHLLYGFFSPHERDFYEALLSVKGIGPKIALALIGHLPLPQLQRAISEENTAALCRVPGIGKKGAERLIIEMRDKVEGMPPLPESYAVKGISSSRTLSDAMSALVNLGYSQNMAQKALKKVFEEKPEKEDLAQIIGSALKYI